MIKRFAVARLEESIVATEEIEERDAKREESIVGARGAVYLLRALISIFGRPCAFMTFGLQVRVRGERKKKLESEHDKTVSSRVMRQLLSVRWNYCY